MFQHCVSTAHSYLVYPAWQAVGTFAFTLALVFADIYVFVIRIQYLLQTYATRVILSPCLSILFCLRSHKTLQWGVGGRPPLPPSSCACAYRNKWFNKQCQIVK